MSKGVSTIIAVLLMLVITISLSITAFSFVTNFFEQSTSGMVEIKDISCESNSCSLMLRSLDDSKNLDPKKVIVRINDVDLPAGSITWSSDAVPPGGTVTGTINSVGLAGLDRETLQKIKVIGTSGRPQTEIFEIPFGADGPPSVVITIDNPNPDSSQQVTFTASAIDDNSVNSISIFVDGEPFITCPVSGNSPPPCVKPGGPYSESSTHDYYATATDGVNPETTSGEPGSFIVQGAPPTDELPKFTSLTIDKTDPTSKDTITFTAKATDDHGLTKIRIFVDGNKVGIDCPAFGKSYTCIQPGGPFSIGMHDYYATAWDSHSPIQHQTTSETKHFTVSPSSGCAPYTFSQLHGANLIDSVLRKPQLLSEDSAFVSSTLTTMKNAGFTVVRVPMYWEAYEKNPTNFKDEVRLIAQKADDLGIYVFFDNHHFDTTTRWGSAVASSGRGFAGVVVDPYNPTTKYEGDPEVKAFWKDFYKNTIRGLPTSGSGSAWDLQADFIVDIINTVDSHCSVVGYEILNEPHVWKGPSGNVDEDYTSLGAYHTYMAGRISAETDKVIIFTRETAHGEGVVNGVYSRSPSQEYKILPILPAGKTNKLWYWPHLYAVPGANVGSADDQILNWKEVTGTCKPGEPKCTNPTGNQNWKNVVEYAIPIGVGEWATQDDQVCWEDMIDLNDQCNPAKPALGQKMMDAFVCNWAKEGWASTYWSTASNGFGNSLLNGVSSNPLTIFGDRLSDAISRYYPTLPTSCPALPSIRGAYNEKDGSAVDPDTGCPKPPSSIPQC